METYFDSSRKELCNGCGTCALKCPHQAIEMQLDEEGFLYPVVDKEKCVNCGICKNVCSISINKKELHLESDAYVSYNKNLNVRKRSSSGGMFMVLAKYVIEENNGVVFGVELTKEMIVKHSYAESIKEAEKFCGSKYVRSELVNSYFKVKEFLNDGRVVLFTGTPCQCQGLRKYLGKEYDNLLTCEIICHANPSPMVFKMFVKNLEEIYNKSVTNFLFRSKSYGWKYKSSIISLKNGDTIINDLYLNGFLKELINRPSCHNCFFCTEERFSDFTIGDFWGIEECDPKIKDDDTGLSLLCVNTEKGKRVLKLIENEIFLKREELTKSFSHNHHCNVKENKNRKRFFDGIKSGKINEHNIVKYLKKYTKKNLFERVISKFKKVLIKHKINGR